MAGIGLDSEIVAHKHCQVCVRILLNQHMIPSGVACTLLFLYACPSVAFSASTHNFADDSGT